MGHTFREMDPEGARKHDERIDRQNKLHREISGQDLGSFRAGDLPSLLRILDPLHFGSPFPQDLSQLELRISEIKSRSNKNSA